MVFESNERKEHLPEQRPTKRVLEHKILNTSNSYKKISFNGYSSVSCLAVT